MAIGDSANCVFEGGQCSSKASLFSFVLMILNDIFFLEYSQIRHTSSLLSVSCSNSQTKKYPFIKGLHEAKLTSSTFNRYNLISEISKTFPSVSSNVANQLADCIAFIDPEYYAEMKIYFFWTHFSLCLGSLHFNLLSILLSYSKMYCKWISLWTFMNWIVPCFCHHWWIDDRILK